jgi:hypothetical protein
VTTPPTPPTLPTLHDRYVYIDTDTRAALLELLGSEPPAALRDLAACLAAEQFRNTNLDHYYRLAANDQYASDGEIEIDADAIVSIGDEGAYVHGWLYVSAPADTAQWLTTCPNCGERQLVVHEVTLMATGERVVLNTPLAEDGFEVNHPDAQDDGSTTDEVVHCCRCGKNYDLADLSLDK